MPRPCFAPGFFFQVEKKLVSAKIMRLTILPYLASATLQHLQEDAEGIKMQLSEALTDQMASYQASRCEQLLTD